MGERSMTPTAADRIIQDVCDLDPTDYPDDDPDTLRVSRADLRVIVERETATLAERLAGAVADSKRIDALADYIAADETKIAGADLMLYGSSRGVAIGWGAWNDCEPERESAGDDLRAAIDNFDRARRAAAGGEE